MNGFLLDTSVVLLALAEPERLSKSVLSSIRRGPNIISVLALWEVLIKSANGKLDVGDPRTWWNDALDQLDATPLPLQPRHAVGLYRLPSIHKDPFDRMLLAQATSEHLALVTTDTTLARYSSATCSVIC